MAGMTGDSISVSDQVDVERAPNGDQPDLAPVPLAGPGALRHERGDVVRLPHAQLISTTAPLIRFAPDERVRMYVPRMSTFPARVRVMLASPHRSTISRSAVSTTRSPSSSAVTPGIGPFGRRTPTTLGPPGPPSA